MSYLYGSSVQGIQSFIFETNKLKEIAGASEIVENLCTSYFEQFLKENKLTQTDFIINAAGNIRFISDDKGLVETVVRFWPKFVETKAPGVTISQAVIEFSKGLTKGDMDKLEQNLKTQRNKVSLPANVANMVTVRSRRTGKPAIDWASKGEPVDEASRLKQSVGTKDVPPTLLKKSLPTALNKQINHNNYPHDVSDITNGVESSWLAIIHADGNSLGQLIQKMSKSLESGNKDLKTAFSRFSKALDASTIAATQTAVDKVCLKDGLPTGKQKLPFRPVVIGGDDLTIIIRADLAMKFTHVFLEEFQKETAKNLSDLVKDYGLDDFKDGLTACAGVTFVKESFPFYYGIELAEQLCADAKKVSKEIDKKDVPASVSFHKVQDSFVESYSDICDRELRAGDVSFKFGPYGINQGGKLPELKQLLGQVKVVNKSDAPKSGIRKWLTLMKKNHNEAKLWLERVISVSTDTHDAGNYVNKLGLEKPFEDMTDAKGTAPKSKTHLYDLMSLAAIMKGKEEAQK